MFVPIVAGKQRNAEGLGEGVGRKSRQRQWWGQCRWDETQVQRDRRPRLTGAGVARFRNSRSEL
jgi:hypothetical protein